MKNLPNRELEKIMRQVDLELQEKGYSLRRGITHEVVEGIVGISEKLKQTKIRVSDCLIRQLSFLDEDLDRRVSKINIPGFGELYDRASRKVDVVFKPEITTDECTTVRKPDGRYEVALSTELTTNQQAALIHEKGHVILAENKRKIDYYEYKELMPMMLCYLYQLTLGNREKYEPEAVKRILLDVKASAHELLKVNSRFERFQTVTPLQQETMVGNILDANVYLSSFEFLLGLREVLEEDDIPVLKYTSRVLAGDKTTKDMATEFGIDTSNFKRISRALGTYKK